MTNSGRAPELAQLAGLVADRTRATFCLALLDGRAWTVHELATHAGVADSTASEHLGRLVDGGLFIERRQGRHRYVQLASPQVAGLLESLVAHLDPAPAQVGSLRVVTATAALARGRTCYDHLAGRLGVAITEAMTRAELLDQSGGFALTPAGVRWLGDALGIDPATLRATRRPVARPCLDWTERRSHLAGVAGSELCRRFHANQWVRKIGTSRAVRLTPAGETALRELLDVRPEHLEAHA